MIIDSSKILSKEEYKKRKDSIMKIASIIAVSNIISWFPISILGNKIFEMISNLAYYILLLKDLSQLLQVLE